MAARESRPNPSPLPRPPLLAPSPARAPARYSVAAGGIKMGPQVGQGTVRFSTNEEARRALVKLNHSYMGNRYIELFFAT